MNFLITESQSGGNFDQYLRFPIIHYLSFRSFEKQTEAIDLAKEHKFGNLPLEAEPQMGMCIVVCGRLFRVDPLQVSTGSSGEKQRLLPSLRVKEVAG